ncbi:hypothetical protein B0A55_11606 [Friedmanniomyces simplex]|uniref:NmrA-like domain-containing protein n=1 Tax=Friedmanniomyces simplex TaxID=329884 RepID=A0A4U0WB21_9PEZI|nr:hypothetical protein B0A55_11606 [Friedmanniomyces simplex]
MPPIKKVTLLGADSKLGPAILQALLSANFTVTVLKRQSSKSSDDYPGHTTVKRLPDDLPLETLTPALQGQHALIASIKGSQVAIQQRLATACVQAGVSRFIPADFGSCDSSSPLTQELVPLYKSKTELREYLQHLATQHPSFSWTSLVCGHFFDWSLEFIHLWPHERRADILDDGETRFSISTLSRIAEATARILLKPAETGNRMLYVQSFCVTQNQIIGAYEAVMGRGWEVRRFESGGFRDEQKAKAEGGEVEAVEELVWYLGTVDADWRSREGFAMELLGLEDEDLGEAVEGVVRRL